MLIDNLNKVGCNDNIDDSIPMFDYGYDEYYHFKGYKYKDNYDMVFNRLNDLQKIIRSKKRLSMRM
jgi:hypothetical protein